MKITEFDIEISKEAVCSAIGADKSSDIYEEVMEELEAMLPEAYQKIKPVALLEFGTLDEYSQYLEYESKEALYGITSIGRELSAWSTQLFQEGDYLRGMFADAIADNYLFQMDSQIQSTVIGLCQERKKGIVRRLEAPQDIPMSIQKKAYDVNDAENQIGLKIMESYMYDPVKTICQVYVLDDDTTRYNSGHDCTKCGNYTCKFRNVPEVTVTLEFENKEKQFCWKKGKTLLEALREENIFISAICGGRGSCGKCRVQVLEGYMAISEADKKYFSEEELAAGYRLSCEAYPVSNCKISIENRENEDFFVLAGEKTTEEHNFEEDASYGIAVDIGTTTIAMQLIELKTGKAVDVYTTINKQRVYGADVISRITASNSGEKEALKKCILEDLSEGIQRLLQHREVEVEQMVIGANTTMIHLLMGYSCETLGVYPFTPVNIQEIRTNYKELFGKEEYAFDIVMYPGISTYVGGDITAGLYATEFQNRDAVSLFIDLGTNGEMAIGNKEKILVTSTAAGPAFEGGNIVCGTGSVAGAIKSVTLEDGKAHVETIADATPKGICGTGVIDTVYELVRTEIVDETGLMEDEYFEDGILLSEENNIRFYQKDVREIQLAKAAVRAGIETLLIQYGITYDEIDKVFVAGGMGCQVDIHKAVGIGLFSEECEDKIEVVGNSCLKGAVKYLQNEDAGVICEEIVKHATEINLSNDKNFQEFYMQYMYFED